MLKRKNRNYSKASVEQALQEFRSGRMSISKAARMYGFPQSTLSDKKHFVHSRDSPGMPTKLVKQEEGELRKWIVGRVDKGMPVSHEAIRVKANQMLAQRLGPSAEIGQNWAYNFVKRHPEIMGKVMPVIEFMII